MYSYNNLLHTNSCNLYHQGIGQSNIHFKSNNNYFLINTIKIIIKLFIKNTIININDKN